MLPGGFRFLLHPVHLAGLGFGTGLSPRLPGTVGSATAFAVYWLWLQYWPAAALMLFLVLACFAGVYICSRTSRALGGGDHRAIVWDEFTGCWLALALAPAGLPWAAGAFLLFRILDISKPWPLRSLESVGGGLGIMLDDVAAGLAAGALLRAAAALPVLL